MDASSTPLDAGTSEPTKASDDVASVDVSTKECISVVARVRPSKYASENIGLEEKIVQVSVPRADGQEAYRFPFQRVFGPRVTQAEVFNTVGRDLILGAVDGVNCTIFAYGQTGSGKTFTICGGSGAYEDRGIIPRALALIFEEIERRQGGLEFTVKMSFIEVYKEVGIDLLAKDFSNKKEDWPVVTVSLQSGQPVLQGAKCLHIASEEEGLHQYFLGDTHRTVAETPHNLNSSRSHCIFTIYIEAVDPTARTVRTSKVQIVDLAGSERLRPFEKGSQSDKTLMGQAVAINMSLHFLEQVINALNQRLTTVPYRNSFLTKLLKDALGGNARAMMVTTINPDDAALPETISSCRFAQRVARVQTDARVNEEQDPQLVIQALRQENEEIKAALASQGKDGAEPIPEEDLRARIKAYLVDGGTGIIAGTVLGIGSLRDAFVAFRIFREQCWELLRNKLAAGGGSQRKQAELPEKPNGDVEEASATPSVRSQGGTGTNPSTPLRTAGNKDEGSTQGDTSKTAALQAALDERDRECKMLRAALAAQPPKVAPTTKPLKVAAPRPVTKVNVSTQTEGVATPKPKAKPKRPTSADPRPKGMRSFIDFSPEDVVDPFNRGREPAGKQASASVRPPNPGVPDFRPKDRDKAAASFLPTPQEQPAAAQGRRPSRDTQSLSQTMASPQTEFAQQATSTTSLQPSAAAAAPTAPAPESTPAPNKAPAPSTSSAWLRATTALTEDELQLLATKAYQIFLQHDPRAADIWPSELQELRNQRRQCMEEAKTLGEEIEHTKQATRKVQSSMEALKSRLLEAENLAAVDPSQAQKAATLRELLAAEEPKVQQLFNEKRQRYELDFNRLKELRREISHLEHGEKRMESTIQTEFSQWKAAVESRYADALKAGGAE